MNKSVSRSRELIDSDVTIITNKCKYFSKVKSNYNFKYWVMYYDDVASVTYMYMCEEGVKKIFKHEFHGHWMIPLYSNTVLVEYISIIKHNHLEAPLKEDDTCDYIIIDDKMLCIYSSTPGVQDAYYAVTEGSPLNAILDRVLTEHSNAIIYRIPL